MQCFLILALEVTAVVILAKSSNDHIRATTNPVSCKPCVCTGLEADCRYQSLNTTKDLNLPRNISTLLLSHNNFTDISAHEFAQFPNLVYLDLSLNSIQRLDNESFENMNKLTYLNLENNTLKSNQVANDAFRGLYNLKTLRLNYNLFETYPEKALQELKSLENLFMDGLRDDGFEGGFRQLGKLSRLRLSGCTGYGSCKITSLNKSMFVNLPYLKHLDISCCNITHIEPDTFAPITHLQSLNISKNYNLTLKKFGNGMSGISPTLKTLQASNIVRYYTSCVILMKEHVQHLTNTSITHLYLDDNSIENIKVGVLPLFPPNLTFLSAELNKLSFGPYMSELKTLTNLQNVRLSGKSFDMHVPDYGSYESSYEVCDECSEVDLLDGSYQYMHSWPLHVQTSSTGYSNLTLPPNLTYFTSNFTQMTFSFGRINITENNLRYLDLSSNLLQFDGEVIGLENITYLDLSNNLARKINNNLFNRLWRVETLKMAFNFFGWQIGKDINGSIFNHMTMLKHLDISYNGLQTLKGDVIRHISGLEILNVSNNALYNFQPVLNQLKNLTTIDCSGNQIKWLEALTMQHLGEIKKISPQLTINLSRNPLSCECEGLETLKWLYTSKVTPKDMSGYYCLLNRVPTGFNHTDDFKRMIDDVTERCQNNFGIALGCTVIFIVCLCLLVCGILYRYRWKLRYLYYAARLRYLDYNMDDVEEEEFLFDAFVSYADEDRGFVVEDMRSRLEHESSMKLNIHHRDFMPGEPIVSNIVGAIKKSRKTLVLLSRNFLNSKWCRYELHMAQMESVSTGRDLIIIIMYEQVPPKLIPPEFLQLMQSDSYIEYPHAETNKEVFWAHLRRALLHRTQRQRSLSTQP